MNCRTIRRKDIIEDYLAHRLGEALADEFETHLLGCSRCSTLLENMQSLRDGLEERASSIRTAISKGSDFLIGSYAIAAVYRQGFDPNKDELDAWLRQRGLVVKEHVRQVREPNKEDLRVSGWKEIAGFLGCTIRQVQSWEKSEGFPVRRRLSGKLVSVYAFGREIDAWLTQQGFDPKKNKLDAWLRRPRRNPKQGPC